MGFFGNMGDGSEDDLAVAMFLDGGISLPTLAAGLLRLGRPAGGSYDPVCFDTRGRKGRRECPMVLVDHEALLQDETSVVKDTVAEGGFVLSSIKSLFLSEAATCEVRTSAEDGARALGQVVYSLSASPNTRESLVGSVAGGHVLVWRRRPGVINNFSPVFSGQFMLRDGRTVLSGRIGIRWLTRVFSMAWLAGMLVGCVGAILSWRISGEPIQGLIHRPVSFIMAALAVGLVCLCTWGYRADVDNISSEIENALRGET